MSIEKNNYVDFHCHSAIKPYGKSFNYNPIGRNHTYRSAVNSIWYYNPPSLTDKLLNYVINITKFSQANFTSMAKGGVRVVCVSLYPIEKGFFVNRITNEFLRDLTANFATGVGKKRIDAVQGMTNYFKDLQMELDFYRQLDKKVVQLPEGAYRYQLVRNYNEIQTLIEDKKNPITTIAVVLSIEGMHVLNNKLDQAPVEFDFLANVRQLKNWDTPPFFVSMAHHFWNHLCGHAKSFTKLVAANVRQQEGMDSDLTDLGRKVVHLLLDDSNGKRILIDVKHMNTKSRASFYAILDTDPRYASLPIIVSHGAANGLQSFTNPAPGGSQVAQKLNPAEINFFNEELIRVAKSKGIFGLQLDERRVASAETIKNTKHSLIRSKIMHYRSELLWYQVQHIVEVLDNESLFAWDCIALGSDFDGIIDPLNSFWTAEELPYLADFMERHAHNYVQTATFKLASNKLDADEIVARIMSSNGLNFLKRHFR